MPKFKPYNHKQTSIVVINYEEQLQPGTFEHAIHYLITEKLDLSIFYKHFNNDSKPDKGSKPLYRVGDVSCPKEPTSVPT